MPGITLAEGVGFEPTVPCGTRVFKTLTIDHSDTPPDRPCLSVEKAEAWWPQEHRPSGLENHSPKPRGKLSLMMPY